MDSNYLAKIMSLCLSPLEEERREGIRSIEQAKKFDNFGSSLLKLAADQSIQKEIQQNAAIQLKNLVCENWANTGEIMISPADKQIIKDNILLVLPQCNNKAVFKHFIQIINTLIKYENEWVAFLHSVTSYLKSMNQMEIFSGVSCFYKLSKIYEYEIDEKREMYNGCFSAVCESLENLMDNLLTSISSNPEMFSDSVENYLSMEILHKVLKIFIRTIQMGQIPRILVDERRFDKWINYLLFIAKLSFPESKLYLTKIPNTNEELEILRKCLLWRIKDLAFDILAKIFEKFGDITKISRKEQNMKSFAQFVENTYSKQVFETFLGTLYQSKENYIDEGIIFTVFQYFQLILNRKHGILFPLLEVHLETIVKEYLVQSATLTLADFDMMKNNTKQYIYKQFEKGISMTTKRVAACLFVNKLCDYKTSVQANNSNSNVGNNQVKKFKRITKPVYLEFVYNYLTSTLTDLENQITSLSDPQNFSYLILLKESCVRLLESIDTQILGNFPAENIEHFITTFLANDLDRNYSLTLPWLRERAFSLILKLAPYIIFQNENLIKHIVTHLCNNLIANDDLAVSIKCALIIPKILNSSSLIKELFRSDIANVFSIYLKLMQELDLEQLLKCLEKLVDVYSIEVLGFSIELTKELVSAFERLMKPEDNNNTDDYDSEDEEDSSDENNNISSANGIIRTVERLFQVTARNKNFELFYEIEKLMAGIIIWSFNSGSVSSVFNDIVGMVYTIIDESPQLSDLSWSFYPLLINSIVVIDQQGCVEAGLGYENLQDIIPVLLKYMIKDPDRFATLADSNCVTFMSSTLGIISHIVSFAKMKKDEVNCGYAVKIIITMLETYKDNKLDLLIKDLLIFIIEQMKSSEQGFYKSILLQAIGLCYVYNPKMVNSIIEGMNLTNQLFEMWIPQINNFRFDFEYRRTAMAFTSLLLIDAGEMNPMIKTNIGFIFNKIVELLKKLNVIRENKAKEKDEADVSGEEDNDSEEEAYELQSKTKNFKSQLKDFIDDDLGDGSDDEDEDYNEFTEGVKGENKFKTMLDAQDENLYLRDIMNYLANNNSDFYNYLMSQINQNVVSELSLLFENAEKRISQFAGN